MRAFLWTIVLTVLAGSASSQPAFDCSAARGAAEELVCSDPALAELDRRLDRRYAAALEAAQGLGAGNDEALATLRGVQRGWIKGRNDCWKATDLRACVESAHLQREAELVALWMLEPPREVVEYVCDSSPANTVTVFFFDTELPAIRLERGDSIRAGWQVIAASGSKYATAFGGGFWTKGQEALLDWEEGSTTTCARHP